MLLEGLDEIGQTLAHNDAISAFEARRSRQHDWISAIPVA
jgi:3-isopropylmalate dehydratase small subunit